MVDDDTPSDFLDNVGKTRINHPPVITICIGGIITIPKRVVILAQTQITHCSWPPVCLFQVGIPGNDKRARLENAEESEAWRFRREQSFGYDKTCSCSM
jgi:hypothetical protein